MSISVYISGVNSDEDPSPGIGTARSIREGFPNAKIYAVDYSVRSSGLHHPVFDDVMPQPAWSELDLQTYASQIRKMLNDEDRSWFSGLDVECTWLAESLGRHPRLLIPSLLAQEKIRKPEVLVAKDLGMKVPTYLSASSAPTELHTLGRRSGWKLWVKSCFHGAYQARNFQEVQQSIAELQAYWPVEQIFVQQHIEGLERSIAFGAFQGRLLAAAEVEKRSVTAQGKTWGAAVYDLEECHRSRLSQVVADLEWSGGGEVEFVRDNQGDDWIIDFNPRFPAYVHGLTLCGCNLPSLIIEEVFGSGFVPRQSPASQFIRVVHEIEVRKDLPIPRLLNAPPSQSTSGKHPSLQPQLVKRLQRQPIIATGEMENGEVRCPTPFEEEVLEGATPSRHRNHERLKRTLDGLAKALSYCNKKPQITPALSIKTDPSVAIARSFINRGWWAEVISAKEVDWALQQGFRHSQIVFNGPAIRNLPPHNIGKVAVAFADSYEALELLLEAEVASVVGLRLRPGAVDSRFGLNLDELSLFRRVTNLLRSVSTPPLGVHVHFASDVCGTGRWFDLLEHTLAWADALRQASDIDFTVFDLGGGWHPIDFREIFLPRLPHLQKRIGNLFGSATDVIIEPGKAISSESAVLSSTVVEVRPNGSTRRADVLVDASISDLPMAASCPHSILQFRDGVCLGTLTGGTTRILGSICMEMDILAEAVGFPSQPKPGDVLLFDSAGAYNSSMSWHFAKGLSRDG